MVVRAVSGQLSYHLATLLLLFGTCSFLPSEHWSSPAGGQLRKVFSQPGAVWGLVGIICTQTLTLKLCPQVLSKVPRIGWLKQQKLMFSHLEAQKCNIEEKAGWFFLRPLLSLQEAVFLCIPSVLIYVQIFFLHGHQSRWPRTPPNDLTQPSCLFKGPVSKYGHTLRCSQLWLQHA